jgi:hypothetical protein
MQDMGRGPPRCDSCRARISRANQWPGRTYMRRTVMARLGTRADAPAIWCHKRYYHTSVGCLSSSLQRSSVLYSAVAVQYPKAGIPPR